MKNILKSGIGYRSINIPTKVQGADDKLGQTLLKHLK
jgi:hypothetical protein